jgi:hypothetical protein
MTCAATKKHARGLGKQPGCPRYSARMLAAGAERQLKIIMVVHDLIRLIHSKVDTAVDLCVLFCAERIAVRGHGWGVICLAI